MKTTTKKAILSVIVMAIVQCCYSQGFMNLNFESASLSGLSDGYLLPTTSAFPYWSAYMGPPGSPTYSGSLSTVGYDTVTLGGSGIFLVDSNNPSGGPLQGNYSLLLEGSEPGADSTASLGQTGTIPSTALSLTFWANIEGSLDVSFDGQALSLVDISDALNYTEYAVNISAYTGETGQLLFTAPVDTFDEIDNIQFSTSPVPEPGVLALSALGGLFFAWRRCRK